MAIEIKIKKCKAIGKARGFEGCGEDCLKRTYGLCRSCYASWLFSTPEGKVKLDKATLTATKDRRELQAQSKAKKDRTSLRYLLENTKTACHEYIKLRDHGKPCVSCGESWHKDHQAGHWKKAETYSALKFDEDNIHNQCEGCNIHKDGNVQLYGDRIHLRIGQQGKAEIERKAIEYRHGAFNWDRETLVKKRAYYKNKIKELKNAT